MMEEIIHKLILSYDDEDTVLLLEMLDNNFKTTVTNIFSNLKILIKRNDKKSVSVYCSLIESISDELDDFDKTNGFYKTFSSMYSNLGETKLEDYVKHRLNNSLVEIEKFIQTYKTKDIIKILDFLIFELKNAHLIQRVLYWENISSIDNDTFISNLFVKIINYYCNLPEDETKDINYFYYVMMLFLNESSFSSIKTNRLYLLSIMQNKSYKKHVMDMINRFNDSYKVPISELEEKYKVKLSRLKSVYNEVCTFSSLPMERYSFLYQDVVTIDGEETKCFDDGFFLEKNKDGSYTLYLHFIDIPSVIPFNSYTLKSAFRQGESLYTYDMLFPMYPDFIANNLCSLLADNKRNVLTFKVRFDSEFNMIPRSFKVVLGKIMVRHQLSYKRVDHLLEKGDSDICFRMMLQNMARLSLKLRSDNPEKEEYRLMENMFRRKDHHESNLVDISLAANIVHEFMLLANRLVAEYMVKRDLPYIYRVHTKVKDYGNDLDFKKLFDFSASYHTNSFNYQNLLQLIENSYFNAHYSLDNVGHYGLGYSAYSHSSSPARRYADSLAQYILHDLVIDKNLDDSNIYRWEELIKRQCAYLNQRKRQNDAFCQEYDCLASKKLIRK